jgi:hypothetical protein
MEQDQRLTVKINAALMAKLDDIRRTEPDLPPRHEMVRRLIERAAERPGAAQIFGRANVPAAAPSPATAKPRKRQAQKEPV